MLTEEAVVGVPVLEEGGAAGFEHLGDPAVGEVAIADDAEFVDHPIDGFATLAATKVITLGSTMHLFGGKAVTVGQLMTEVGIVGATFFDQGGPR